MVEGRLNNENENDRGKGAAMIQDLLKILSVYYPELSDKFKKYAEEQIRLKKKANSWDSELEELSKANDDLEKLEKEAFFKDPEKLDEIRRMGKNPSWDDFSKLNCMQNGNNRLDQLQSLIRDIKPALELVDPLLTIKKAVEILCTPKVKLLRELADTECKALSLVNEKNHDKKVLGYKGFIDEEFQKGIKADPLGIVYDGHVLKTTVDESHGVHISLLIGRKEINGVCHYLIRNSWGKSCENYSWECEDGDLWISEDELFDKTLKLAKPFYSSEIN